MTEQDQKYLAEKMGIEYSRNYPYFETPHGFFVAFEWAKKQEWWDKFQEDFFIGVRMFGGKWEYGMQLDMIGPRFAEELVTFLRSRE